MPGVRRSNLAVEATRRNQEQRTRIGGEIRTMRERRGWTRIGLAKRAGLGRMVESRIERGLGTVDLDALQRLGIALGQPVIVSFGRDLLDGPVDAAHLAMQELVLRLGRAVGYAGTFELPTRPAEPWRSVDVGLEMAAARRLILVECWNTIGDVGAAARSSERKRAEIEAMAAGRWGETARVGVLWVVRATARNQALLARYPELFASRFPASSIGWVTAMTEGTPPPDGSGLVWCDVGATRIHEWRRRS